ncbi:transposase [Pseudomonas sp. NPDC087346]|uniref:transposase n=1 Tax=Pseudomonas sp. NPDC087346 TaxID=3364438 RepID=UPI00381A20B8
MVRHAEITAHTGMKINFADPHRSWQRGSNENTNDLLPNGTVLTLVSQERLDEIAVMLNTRARQTPGWKCPLEVIVDYLQLLANNKPETTN